MQTPIDTEIDDLPMHEMDTEKAIAKLDPNSIQARIKRKQIRYQLYCLRSQTEGKPLPENLDKTLVGHFMLQPGFDGFKNFAVTWDVALHDPMKVVSRNYSETEEWDRVVQAKFPQIQPDGSIKYPDMKVKEAVDTEYKKQVKEKKKKGFSLFKGDN